MNLRSKTVSSLFWTISQQFSVQLINFVVQIILARILSPSDFGLIAMLTVFVSVGVSLMDNGMTSSLIRTSQPDESDYSSVFYINVCISLLIYFILFFAAPIIAKFYNQPLLTDILRVYTLSFVIRALSQVQITKLTKQMNFKLQLKIQIPSVLISGIAGVIMALNGYGVWSLVFMNIAQVLLSTLQYWIFGSWKPSAIMDFSKLKTHFSFGYKLTLSGLINTIYSNVYNLIIGKLFSSTELGYYNRADTLRMFPVQNISTALNKVTYPLFASIQDDNIKLKELYKRLMLQVIYWQTPLMVLLILVAEPLFRLILTEKWVPAVPYFQLLCITGILYPLHSYNLNILNVKGRSDLFLKLEIIKKIIITLGILLAIPYGIYGLLYFQIVSSFISYFINSFYSGRMINYDAWQQIKDISPIIGLSIIVGVLTSIFQFKILGFFDSDVLFIGVVGLFFLSVYFMISYMFKISSFFEIKKMLIKR